MIESICSHVFEAATGFGVGHIVHCPVPHLEEVPRILEVERAQSEQHYATKFEIVQMNDQHFRAKKKLPIKALSLGDTEELIISKAKRRPCVIVSNGNTSFLDSGTIQAITGRKHLQDQSMILAPLYGTATPDDPKGFPPIMVARIKVLLYNQFFWLPAKCSRSNISIGKECIVRLDRLFAATPTRGAYPLGKKLAEEPLLYLRAMLRERFGGAEDEEMQLARSILIEALPAEARPT